MNCPNCGSGNIHKSGKIFGNKVIQRYKCSECQRWFSENTAGTGEKTKLSDKLPKELSDLSKISIPNRFCSLGNRKIIASSAASNRDKAPHLLIPVRESTKIRSGFNCFLISSYKISYFYYIY